MTFLYTLLSLIAILLIIAYMLPRDSKIQVEQIIDTPKAKVWDYIKFIKNQENYSVRVMADPLIKMIYTGIDGEVGFKSARDSDMKNVGKGEQEITKIDNGSSYDVEIRFEKPMKMTNFAKISLESISDNETKITNAFTGTSPRPLNLMSLIMKSVLQKDMQKNLDNLKVILEK